jgi:SAM-dependent methyltransferase
MSSEANENVQLRWTGERYLPTLEGDIELEHLHRYAIARDLSYGKDVLDIACGEGYGSELLATVARKVVGVDISEEAIAHASQKYVRPNISFAVGSCACIPLPDASVDIVVSFETIEHHDQHLEMMREIRRVLRPEGVLIISSPDKHEYSDVPGYNNEYHVRELYLSEFTDLLATEFRTLSVFGQRVYFGSLVAPIDGRATRFATFSRKNESIRREAGVMRPNYYIAVASNGILPEIHSGLYEGASYLSSQIAGRDLQIAGLSQAVAERDAQVASLSGAIAERDAQVAALYQAVAERDGQIATLSGDLASHNAQADSLNATLGERDASVTAYLSALSERQAMLDAATSELSQLKASFQGMESSLTWRLTAPLRALRKMTSRRLDRRDRSNKLQG